MEDAGGWRPDAEGRRPDGISTQRRIQNSDLRLVRPVPQTHPAHQAQSEILADGDLNSKTSLVIRRQELTQRLKGDRKRRMMRMSFVNLI